MSDVNPSRLLELQSSFFNTQNVPFGKLIEKLSEQGFVPDGGDLAKYIPQEYLEEYKAWLHFDYIVNKKDRNFQKEFYDHVQHSENLDSQLKKAIDTINSSDKSPHPYFSLFIQKVLQHAVAKCGEGPRSA